MKGVRALLGGIGFVVGRPAIWGWALVPVLVALLLFAGLSGLAIWGGSELAGRLVTDSAWGWALRIVLGILGIALAFFVACSLAQPLAGFALERIARRQEIALGGPEWPDSKFGFLRSLAVTLTALVITLPILGLLSLGTILFPPASIVTVPLKFVVGGLAIAWDFLDYPFSLRGMGVGARLTFIRSHFLSVLGFGCAAAALLLVPGLDLFLLPIGVAAATRLVRNELADRPRDV